MRFSAIRFIRRRRPQEEWLFRVAPRRPGREARARRCARLFPAFAPLQSTGPTSSWALPNLLASGFPPPRRVPKSTTWNSAKSLPKFCWRLRSAPSPMSSDRVKTANGMQPGAALLAGLPASGQAVRGSMPAKRCEGPGRQSAEHARGPAHGWTGPWRQSKWARPQLSSVQRSAVACDFYRRSLFLPESGPHISMFQHSQKKPSKL